MKKTTKLIVFAWLFISLIAAVLAAKPVFQNVKDLDWFNLTQGKQFTYFIIATDSDSRYPINFTHDHQGLLFHSFKLVNYNNITGLMNFTPDNWDVGDTHTGPLNYTICVTAKNKLVEHETVCLHFRVYNVNDPPNITWWYPHEPDVATVENASFGFWFNYSASDIDIPWGDVINATWRLDKTVQKYSTQQNGSWIYHPGFCSAGKHNVSLMVADKNKTTNSVNWRISVNNTNRAPQFNRTIANITWQENRNLTKNLSLGNHFYDLDYLQCTGAGKDNITYKVSGNYHIQVVINQSSGLVSFYPEHNWYGIENVTFYLNDSYATVASNRVRLNVSHVDQPPVLNFIPDQLLAVGVHYQYLVTATDPDVGEQLYYKSNSSIFTIGRLTGLINFTPLAADIGIHYINISVNDTVFVVSQIAKFTVRNNTPPYIQKILNQEAMELSPFLTTINATDKDKDNLTFTDNATFFNITTVMLANGSAEGVISFTAGDHDVGTHFVKIRVWDSKGAYNSTIVNFTILHYNYPPSFPSIPDIALRINHTYMLNITATDPNEDDILTFTSNASFFTIDSANSVSPAHSMTSINVTNVSLLGVHYVNISVHDDDTVVQKHHTQTVKFAVIVNHPPAIYPISPKVAPEDSRFILIVNGHDPDDDILVYDANTTLFKIKAYNSTAAIINFTPLEANIGMYYIKINATDPYNGFNSTVLSLNVTPVNDPPIFITNQSNYTLLEDHNSIILFTGWDEENATLTMWSNNSLFNMTRYNKTTFRMNLTPIQKNVGNYTVNISLTDGYNNVSRLFFFKILDVNDAPIIIAFKPNQTTIASNENVSLLFNITQVYDEENDTIIYIWYLDGVNKSKSQYWTYTPGYCDSGKHNVSVRLIEQYDASKYWNANSSAYMYWNVTVNNVNRGPYLNLSIPSLKWPEDTNLINNLTLSNYFYDPDYNECAGSQRDNMTYKAYVYGTAYVQVIILGAKASFYPFPDWNGIQKIYFAANDSHNIANSNNVTLNVTAVNDPPALRYIPAQHVKVGEKVIIYVNASDVDTNILTFAENSTYFNITRISGQLGLINFTALSYMVGNHTVHISVNDSQYWASQNVLFSINGTNRPPNITSIYPYGWPLANYTTFGFANRYLFSQATRINLSEFTTILFNVSATDPDNDPIYYKWLLDGKVKSTNSSWYFNIGYKDDGNRNLTLEVRDRLGNKDWFYWNVSVRNINRKPTFGTKIYTEAADFQGGNTYRLNISDEAITLIKKNATAYYTKGTYTSPVIDFQKGPYSSLARPNLSTIRWNLTLPPGTSVIFQTKTSLDGSSWGNWSPALVDSTGSRIDYNYNFTQNVSPATWPTRYLQYRMNISTTNTASTPTVKDVKVVYNAANFLIVEGLSVSNWIDLEDYFSDPDNETLAYNATDILNLNAVRLSIKQNHYVDVNPQSGFSGAASFKFTAKDQDSTNATASNIVSVIVKKHTTTTVTTPSTGGGGATRYIAVPKKELVNITKPVSLEIVLPKPFIFSSKLEIVAPIELVNKGNITLKRIGLYASTSEPDVSLEYETSFFNQLKPGDRTQTNLIMRLKQKKTNPFQINISAISQDPSFKDTAVISINPYPVTESVNETVRFVRDLLSTNPECLELNEMLTEANKAITDKKYDDAQKLLNNAIDACRYLISTRTKSIEQPAQLSTIETLKRFVQDNQVELILVLAATLATVIYSAVVIARHKRKTPPQQSLL